ncbi:hypothetical protein LGN17_21350 [Burkholderia sp. AU30280]|uniref:hypothetical protein n=1 Tax=Burkholderia sp. AU30280 TaxID=2879628 RepID=UPI001CF5D7DC|nr:hypothetical protein [Burkholderia sp. AU30280]MCA8275035.1 hypothetical protein [Burkholderia sp. AU30280]
MTAGRFPVSPAMARPEQRICRPLRDLIEGLTLLPVGPYGEPDYAEADSDVLVKLAEAAGMAIQIVHDGLASVGILHAHSTQQINDGHPRIVHAVALGRLQIELCELLSHAYGLGIDCRRYTADYVAPEGGQP